MTRVLFRAALLSSAAAGMLLAAGPASAGKLTHSGPVVCKNNRKMTLRAKHIVARGAAVVAKGNCRLTIIGSTIRGAVGVRASDNAAVFLVRSDTSGTRFAVRASDNAEVTARKGFVRGRIKTSENGEFKNRRARRIKRAAPIGAIRGGRAAVRGGGAVHVHTGPRGTRVNTGRGGVAVRTGPGGTHVRAGGTHVRTGPGGTHVRTGRGGVAVRTGPGGTHVRAGGTHVRTGGAHAHSGARGGAIPAGLKARGPLFCGGAKTLTVRNRYVRTPGSALKVVGSCDITLINCHLVSTRGTAIVMKGSGDVKLVNSYVWGKKRAVSMVGSGDLVAKNSTVVGKVSKVGSGDIKRHRSTFRRSHRPRR